jgi:PAS domain S-box-containing protein
VAEVWPEVASQIVPLLDQVYQTGEPYSLSDASFLVNIDGGLKEACFNFSYTPLKDDAGQVSGILVLVQETTAQVNAHRQIEEAHALLDTIFTSAPIGLGFWDRELRFTRLNPALAEMNGLPVEAHLGKTPGEVLPNLVDLQQVMETWRQVIETGQPLLNVEINGETPARPGEPRTWLESWYPVKVGQEIIGVGAVVQEITERKRMEEQLTAALAEKETLLKEVYHRIKNNLQGVSNLLYLQSLHLQEDSESRRAFEDTRNRIKAIALIHDKLHRSMDLARLDFADYILSLARQLVQSFKIDAGLIKLEVDFDDVLIDPKVATSLGIIVNELLTNALKHAFPPELDRQGELQIKLYAVDEEYMCLSVRDNGIGLPENFDPAATESLGLQLVTTLTASLQGRVELERDGGTTFRILLPRPT